MRILIDRSPSSLEKALHHNTGTLQTLLVQPTKQNKRLVRSHDMLKSSGVNS